MSITNGSGHWDDKSACKTPENFGKIDFFTADPEEKNKAKNLCFICPVRGDCIQFALENGKIWGIWGGKDENEIRRTLSVNADNNEVRRGRYPQCPYCGARTSRLKTKIIDLPNGGRWTTAKVVECDDCGFEWRSRSSANAVTAYFAERKAKSDRRAAKNAKKKALPASGKASSIKRLPSSGVLPRQSSENLGS